MHVTMVHTCTHAWLLFDAATAAATAAAAILHPSTPPPDPQPRPTTLSHHCTSPLPPTTPLVRVAVVVLVAVVRRRLHNVQKVLPRQCPAAIRVQFLSMPIGCE